MGEYWPVLKWVIAIAAAVVAVLLVMFMVNLVLTRGGSCTRSHRAPEQRGATSDSVTGLVYFEIDWRTVRAKVTTSDTDDDWDLRWAHLRQAAADEHPEHTRAWPGSPRRPRGPVQPGHLR